MSYQSESMRKGAEEQARCLEHATVWGVSAPPTNTTPHMITDAQLNTTLPINEMFDAFQGEGTHTGRAAFFIRTMGCPVGCPWCDSPTTWKAGETKGVRLTVSQIVEEAKKSKAGTVVITGGEPTIHKLLTPLAVALKLAGKHVHLETCGAFPIDPLAFKWITVSPKTAKLPLAENVSGFVSSEFKLIIETPGDIPYWIETLSEIIDSDFLKYVPRRLPTIPVVWLHPEWSQRENPEVLNAITEAVRENPEVFRAGWQVHKLYDCDRRGAVPIN